MPTKISPVLPDIHPCTHFVGLCGTNKWQDEEGALACSPSQDGWMLSDFYLLNHLFRGLGKSQAWFTCLEPTFLVEKYDEFAHGNCYMARRVVLDKSQMPDETTLHVKEPADLLQSFLQYFSAECSRAQQADEPVLLCLHAHGQDTTFGLEIGGDKEEGNPILDTAHVASIVAENPGLRLTILMFSCFSGGWAVSEILANENGRHHATVITAAGPQAVSESWALTQSLGRARGSMYMSALINVLEMETLPSEVNNHVLGKPDTNSTQPLNTKEFAQAITSQLLNLVDPRFGTCHDHRFEVQGDAWDEPYPTRTGIPLAYYQERLLELRMIPPRLMASASHNRGMSSDEVESWEREHPNAPQILAMARYGGSIGAVKKMVRNMAVKYMKSKPGRDSMADNIRPHRMINNVIQRPQLVPEPAWASVLDILQYRLGTLDLADNLAYQAGLRPEKAWTWDQDAWHIQNENGKELMQAAREYHRRITELDLIPTQQGKIGRYQKPVWFLAVALAESGLSKVEGDLRLDLLKHSKLSSCSSLQDHYFAICNLISPAPHVKKDHPIKGGGMRITGDTGIWD